MFADSLRDALTAPMEVAKGAHGRRGRRAHFLKNVRINEVSLVPVGANRRTFTVMKADNSTDLFGRLERALVGWLAAR